MMLRAVNPVPQPFATDDDGGAWGGLGAVVARIGPGAIVSHGVEGLGDLNADIRSVNLTPRFLEAQGFRADQPAHAAIVAENVERFRAAQRSARPGQLVLWEFPAGVRTDGVAVEHTTTFRHRVDRNNPPIRVPWRNPDGVTFRYNAPSTARQVAQAIGTVAPYAPLALAATGLALSAIPALTAGAAAAAPAAAAPAALAPAVAAPVVAAPLAAPAVAAGGGILSTLGTAAPVVGAIGAAGSALVGGGGGSSPLNAIGNAVQAIAQGGGQNSTIREAALNVGGQLLPGLIERAPSQIQNLLRSLMGGNQPAPPPVTDPLPPAVQAASPPWTDLLSNPAVLIGGAALIVLLARRR